MKILYWKDSGDVFFAKKNSDWVGTPYRTDGGDYYLLSHDGSDNTHQPARLYEIDELEPDNFLLMADLLRCDGKVDVEGRTKYCVIGGELSEKEGWEEARSDDWI